MVAATHGMEGPNVIRKVNDTLQGPIVDILSQFVPELKAMPQGQAFERTLDDIALLDRCFLAFRSQRDRFRNVLVDTDKNPVTDDSALLACGRTLNDVVAMVVRTAAKRYFRRRHGCAHKHIAPRLHSDVHEKGLVHRIAAVFDKKPPQPITTRRAEELYDALKEHLLHDWQVKLVPTYAVMSPTLVRSLGAKLLEVREIEHLQRILDDPAEAAKLFDDPTAPAPAPAAVAAPAAAPVKTRDAKSCDERARLSEVISPDGKRLRPEAFAAMLLRPEIRAQIKGAEMMMKNTEILRGVGAVPVKLLVAELGLRLDQLTVFFLVANEVMGPANFTRMFGVPGDGELVMRVTQKGRAAGISQKTSLEECANFVRKLFARFSA